MANSMSGMWNEFVGSKDHYSKILEAARAALLSEVCSFFSLFLSVCICVLLCAVLSLLISFSLFLLSLFLNS